LSQRLRGTSAQNWGEVALDFDSRFDSTAYIDATHRTSVDIAVVCHRKTIVIIAMCSSYEQLLRQTSSA